MVNYYVQGYYSLIDSGKLLNSRYQDNRQAKLWLYSTVPDLIWRSRKTKEITLLNRIRDLRYSKNIIKRAINRFPIFKMAIQKIKIIMGIIRQNKLRLI